ncbi:MAG TPA: phage tail sheath C-terminal domain-containing protein, partial [Myxococcota bacterium]|nr:phage tail sheath C-terminal domain-containing protein [Myxococcota bacterium]
FVLASPHGCAGALAGRVGSLAYFRSPTMKTLVGLPELPIRHGQEDQKALLIGRLLPVAKERGRGVIVVKGITTDGEQISVRRVADRASRGVKLIGDLFIGRLNNADGRAALRQKLSEFLYQMQRDGAIVPSTDGESPAFQLEVHSTQDDFSKGIVRVDLAVRPVRAIDFIYATLLVQV